MFLHLSLSWKSISSCRFHSKSKCRAIFIVKLLWNSTFCETRFTNTTKLNFFYISVTGAGNPTVWRSRRGTEHKDDHHTAGRWNDTVINGAFSRKLPATIQLGQSTSYGSPLTAIISVRRENPPEWNLMGMIASLVL